MLFFNKVAGLSPEACNFNKKETLAQVFYHELCEISSNTFLQNTYGKLLPIIGILGQNNILNENLEPSLSFIEAVIFLIMLKIFLSLK